MLLPALLTAWNTYSAILITKPADLHGIKGPDCPIQDGKEALRRRPHVVMRVAVASGSRRDGLVQLIPEGNELGQKGWRRLGKNHSGMHDNIMTANAVLYNERDCSPEEH